MIHNFLELPTFLMCFVSMLISAGVSIIVLFLLRKKIHWETFKENHEVGGFLFNALGLIYAVLIAFVVYATWSDYNESSAVCEKEADVIQSLYFDCEGLPPESRDELRQMTIEYLEMIIKDDWPLLAKSRSNPASRQKLIDIWDKFNNIDDLKTEKEKIFYNEVLSKLNDMTELRRLRILSAQNHIPVIIWTVILIGALTSIGFSLFFGTRSFIIQASMTSLFAMTNVIVIVMILALDHPFTGDIGITTDAYEQILKFLRGAG